MGAALQAASMLTGEMIESLVDDSLEEDESLAAVPSSSGVNVYGEAYEQYSDAVSAITNLYRS